MVYSSMPYVRKDDPEKNGGHITNSNDTLKMSVLDCKNVCTCEGSTQLSMFILQGQQFLLPQRSLMVTFTFSLESV